jgi:hypothetical protein
MYPARAQPAPPGHRCPPQTPCSPSRLAVSHEKVRVWPRRNGHTSRLQTEVDQILARMRNAVASEVNRSPKK